MKKTNRGNLFFRVFRELEFKKKKKTPLKMDLRPDNLVSERGAILIQSILL